MEGSALAQEAVLGEGLLEVVSPRREVRVRVGLDVPAEIVRFHCERQDRLNILVDVGRGGEVRGGRSRW